MAGTGADRSADPPQPGDLPPGLRWNEVGLIPALIQNAATGRLLMLGWMNREALTRTLRTRRVHFFSRSRQVLWRKGETSGNELQLRALAADCDRDALLVTATPAGPTCHTGEVSCFFREVVSDEGGTGTAAKAPDAPGTDRVLERLAGIIRDRAAARPEDSYTAKLLAAGPRRIAQKVGEEGVETALAGAAGDATELVSEAADLLYHLLVLFESRNVPPTGSPPNSHAAFPPAAEVTAPAGCRPAE